MKPSPKFIGYAALALGGAALGYVLFQRAGGKKLLIVGDKKKPDPAPAPKADDPKLD